MSRSGKRTLIHGVINLILPFAMIALRQIILKNAENPWAWFLFMVVLAFLPFFSDAIAIIIACVRLKKSREKVLLAGLFFSVLAIPLQLFLRFGAAW